MQIKESHLIGIFLLVAVVASFVLQRQQNQASAKEVRDNLVTSCILTGKRDAYEANGFRVLSQRVGGRANAGDEQSAAQYLAASESVAGALPRPKNLLDPVKMIEVDTITAPDGRQKFELTQDALELITKGCNEAF